VRQLNTDAVPGVRDTGRRGPLAPPVTIAVLDHLLSAQPTTVLDLQPETPTLVSVRLERPPGFTFRAGQFGILRLSTSAGPDMRPLSFASAPQERDLRFVTRRGPSVYKEALLALRSGDPVKVSRAVGSFGLDSTRPAVLVSGGIGAAPLRSMAVAASTERRPAPLRLLLSNRTVEEIPFRIELEELTHVHPDMRITWVVSSQTGRINQEHLRRHNDELPDALYYVTGPASLVEDVVGVLPGMGIHRSRIRLSKQTLPFPSQRRS
jgi:ferredoxin-NADP reductase